MNENAFARIGDFAIQQVAAESYIDEFFAGRLQALEDVFVLGNNRLGFAERGYTRMTRDQAQAFVERFKILSQAHHYPNDSSGFSATLLFDTQTNEYTLSIRSTEFRNQNDGGDFERDGRGAGADIAGKGFAFAQIASLEQFYRDVVRPAVGNTKLNVTGYSLGGHLATIFTELHPDAVNQTSLFNAAGRGGLKPGSSIEKVVEVYDAVLANPDAWRRYVLDSAGLGLSSLYQRARTMQNSGRPLNSTNIYLDPRHDWAATIASHFTTSVIGAAGRIDPRAEDKITRVIGHATSNDVEGVSKVGIVPTKNVVQVFIEDQPNFAGLGGFSPFGVQLPGDFGNTHSITLLVDSLALMSAFKELDPNLTQAQIESILGASSNHIATGSLFEANARAEGNSLENGLDALRRIFVGSQAPRTDFDSRSGGFGNLQTRMQFHENLVELRSAFGPHIGTARVTSLVGQSAADLERQARADIAYRYALKELNPFVVTGVDQIYAARNTQGELELTDPTTGQGQLGADWMSGRATMLALLTDRNVRDSGYSVATGTSDSVLYEDRRLGAKIVAFDAGTSTNVATQRDQIPTTGREVVIARIFEQREASGRGARVIFGRDDNWEIIETLEGRLGADRIYGGAGMDVLRGGLGDDHVEGGDGDDRLYGEADNDTLLGGTGTDTLNGGTGTDKYHFYTGGGSDTVIDEAEVVDGKKHQRGEIYFGGANGDIRIDGLFTTTDPDRKHYTFTASDNSKYDAAYLGDLATPTPGNLVLWRADDGSNVVTLTHFISGDFGIELEPNAPQRTYSDKFGSELPDNDFITGGPHASSLSSDAPAQKVHGLGGADYILVAHADAQGFGGDGNDYLTNGEGDQSLFGDSGRDVIAATTGEDRLDGGADDDALQGGADADFLDGGDGNDVLDGGAGADVISGGDGHDFILGGGSVSVQITNWNSFADGTLDWGAVDASGNALLRGLTGLSNVEGDEGDVISAGRGHDWVFAGDGLDVVSGGEGNDYLVGQAGDDDLSGDDGDDRLYGDGAQGDLASGLGFFSVYALPHAHGDDSLRGGAGNDFLGGDGGADEIYGGEGNDTLVGDSANVPEQYHGTDFLDGGDGDDFLLGYGKGDTLFGGAGNDELGGDSSSLHGSLHGDDYLDGEDGDDVLHGDGGSDVLFGGAGNDVLDGDASNVAFEFHGNDELDGGEGDDALQGGGGADWLFGGAGNDSLVGDGPGIPDAFAGDDYLDGEAGNDVLEASAGNDTLIGGPGNDILRGQAGDDLYIVGAGDQQDFIDDAEGVNTVRFESGATFASMNVSQITGSDGNAYLYLQHGATDIAYVRGGLTNDSFRYEFADGSVKTAADWRGQLTSFASQFGTSGADTMSGSNLADMFAPGNGNDTILFGIGSGYDRVSGFGQTPGSTAGLDVVRVTGGLTADDLDVVRDQSGNLMLVLPTSGDILQLDSWSVHASGAHAGYQVVFDDGTGLTASDLVARALAPTEGNDVLVGSAGADTIDGGAGDDWIYGNNSSNPVNGGADHNVLLGGAGNDRIQGGWGDDLLDGGPGDDILSGGAGADTFRWGIGDGNDVVNGGGYGEGNVLELKPGIGPQDVTLVQGSIVIYANATGESLTLEAWHAGGDVTVAEIRFADGTVWDATLINENANHATPFSDLLRGIFTADVLHGLGGGDTLEGFAGDDVLYGGDGDDTLVGGAGADELVGGAGNDVLEGGAGGDLLVGGAGDDLLSGHGGQNVYRFRPGDGMDRIVFMGDGGAFEFAGGIDPTDVRITSDGLMLTVDYGSGEVRIALGTAGNHASHGIELVRFADGAQWAREEILARTETVPRVYAGTNANNSIVGGSTEDFIDGGAGNDTLAGGDGDDVLLGGDGTDTLNGGKGDDYLDGGPGNDQMGGGLGSDAYRLGLDTGHDTVIDALLDPFHTWSWPGDADVIFADAAIAPEDLAVSRSGNHLLLETPSSSLSVTNWFASELGPGPLTVSFADGTEWDTAALCALAGYIPPDGLDDVLAGTAGDDLLQGGYGNDAYHFGFGSGFDTIQEPANTVSGELNRATAGSRDILRFGPGVTPQEVRIDFDQGLPEFHLDATGDTVTIASWSDAAAGRVEFAEFEDGTLWDLGRFAQWANDSDHVVGSRRHFGAGGTSVLGRHDEIYFGQLANDSVNDAQGHNTLFGGAGNDTLSTGGGDDQLDGGAGNDTLSPGTGDNRIRFGRGFGQDTLNRFPFETALGTDTVVLGDDVAIADIRLRRGPNASLILELAGTPDSLVINGPLRGLPGRDRLRFEFADGTLWGPDEIEAHIQAVARIEGGTGNNLLTGGDGDDLFIGGEGNDTLLGGGGSDKFVFNRGEGIDTINDKHPHIVFGEGIAPGEVNLVGTNFALGQRDLHLVVSSNGGQLILQGWFDTTGIDGRIEFADGTVWDAAYVGTRVPYAWTSGEFAYFFGTSGADTFAAGATNDTLRGHGGDDSLSGNGGNDQIYGGDGNDVLSGAAGNDTLEGEAGDDTLDGGDGDDVLRGGSGDNVLAGGAGNDQLFGGAGDNSLLGGDGDDLLEGGLGDDILDGGAGADRLYGGTGSDTYLFGPGSGDDTLLDYDGTGADIDTVLLGEGISPEDLAVTRQAGDIVIDVGADSLAIRSFGSNGYGIERLVFANGTEWSRTELEALASLSLARERADVIYGTPQADMLTGLGGDDFIDGGGGDDFIDGGAGDDVLAGGAGDDTLSGGAGADHLTGGEGADVFLVDAGSGSDAIADLQDGDTLRFGPGIAPAGVRIARDLDHLYLELDATGQFVTLENWFALGAGGEIAFEDGTTWIGASLKSQVDALTDGDDFLVGSSAGETIAALGGLDVVYAGEGDDVVLGGGGSDTLQGEAGDDLLEGGDGDDAPVLALAIAVPGFTHGPDFVRGSGGDNLMEALGGDDTAYGGPGNDVLLGGDGDDYLGGEAGDDVLDGGPGRDILEGGAGNDRYVFGAGYGEDWIVDTGGLDEVAIDASLAAAATIFTRDLANLYMTAGADRLVLVDWFHRADTRVEAFRFADGAVLDEAAVRLALAVPAATTGHDTNFGSDRGETLLGLAGEDALYGEGGDDVLDGGSGSDYMLGGTGDDSYYVDNRLDRVTERAGEGNDTVIASVSHELPAHVENLFLAGAALNGTGNEVDNVIDGNAAGNQLRGGRGDDVLRGGAGNDLYLYDRGDGNDTIEDLDATPGNVDELRFGVGIAGSDVRVRRTDEDLQLRVRGGGEVRVANWFDPAMRVEIVRFADGEAWDAAMLEYLASLPSNEPPLLARPIADVSVLEDSPFKSVLPPGTFSDPDTNDVLVYSAAQAHGAPLPAWLGFDAANASFAGTPANEDVGEYAIRVTAADTAGESASDEFVLTVVNVNDAPGLVSPIADQSADAGAPFTLALEDGMFADEDAGDMLSHDAARADGSALPAWLAFDAATRTFSGTPGEADAGALDVRVTATDLAGASASDEFRITVTAGDTGDGEHLVGTRHADLLVGTRHDDVLEGRQGNDLLIGLTGDDAYLYRKGDGHDWILDSGGADTLRFAQGIGETDVTVLRRHGDLVLKVRGDAGSVTVKNWFLAEALRVERVEFAGGGAWDEAALRARARYWHDDTGFDAPWRRHGRDDSPHPRQDDGGRGGDGPGRREKHDVDAHAPRDAGELIEARLRRAARYDFSALAAQLGRSRGTDAGATHAASRWDAIRRATGQLVHAEDDSDRGWDRGRDEDAQLHGWREAAGWGHPGSTGQRAGFAGLRTFDGLGEGLRRLG